MFCVKSKEAGSSCYKLGGTCTKCNKLCGRIKSKCKDTFTQVKPVFNEPKYTGFSLDGELTPNGFDVGDNTSYKDVGVGSKSNTPGSMWCGHSAKELAEFRRAVKVVEKEHIVPFTDEEVDAMDLPEGKTVCRYCGTEIDKFPHGKRRGAPRKYCSDDCRRLAINIQNNKSKDKCNNYRKLVEDEHDLIDKLRMENIKFGGYDAFATNELIYVNNIYDCITEDDFRDGMVNKKLGNDFEYRICRPIDGYNSAYKVGRDIYRHYRRLFKPNRKKKDIRKNSAEARATAGGYSLYDKLDWDKVGDKYYTEFRDEYYELEKYDKSNRDGLTHEEWVKQMKMEYLKS